MGKLIGYICILQLTRYLLEQHPSVIIPQERAILAVIVFGSTMNSGTEDYSQSQMCFIYQRTVPLRLVGTRQFPVLFKNNETEVRCPDERCTFSYKFPGSATRASYLITSHFILMGQSLCPKIAITEGSSPLPGFVPLSVSPSLIRLPTIFYRVSSLRKINTSASHLPDLDLNRPVILENQR